MNSDKKVLTTPAQPESTREGEQVTPVSDDNDPDPLDKPQSEKKIVTGRTYADLLHEQFNQPGVVATLLMALAFILLINQIKSWEWFVLSLGLGVIFNGLWFGVPIIMQWIKGKL